jgi:hypothetical protein
MSKSTPAINSGEDLNSSEISGRQTAWKVRLQWCFGIIAAVVLVLIVRYAVGSDAKPSELGLGPVLIFCLAGMASLSIPWDKLGLRLKKVGPFEFEEVIRNQKKEQSESLAFLQEQLDRLNEGLRAGSESQISNFASHSPSAGLQTVLEKFFREYRGVFYSPLRIQTWGSRQSGFGELAKFSKAEITQTLLTMLATGRVQTRISKKGNTLYGLTR